MDLPSAWGGGVPFLYCQREIVLPILCTDLSASASGGDVEFQLNRLPALGALLQLLTASTPTAAALRALPSGNQVPVLQQAVPSMAWLRGCWRRAARVQETLLLLAACLGAAAAVLEPVKLNLVHAEGGQWEVGPRDWHWRTAAAPSAPSRKVWA